MIDRIRSIAAVLVDGLSASSVELSANQIESRPRFGVEFALQSTITTRSNSATLVMIAPPTH
jgi:hypothetical protein